MMGREKALRLLKRAIHACRADQAEAVLLTEESSLTRFAASEVHQNVAERNATLILRVVMGKKIAVVSTNDLHASSLKNLTERAIALAKVQPPKEDFVSLPEPRPVSEVQTFSSSVRGLTPMRKVGLIRELFSLARDKGFRTSGAFSHGEVEVGVINSLGVESYQAYSDLFLHVLADNGRNTGYASFVSRDVESLDVVRLIHEAMEKAPNREAVRIEPGEYETVLEPYAVSEFLSFLGYLGFHALAVQEGRSFLCGQFGKRLVDSRVTIFDDGLHPEGLQVPFDFEGIPKQRVTFFDGGVAREVTYDSLTAHKEGRASTGHALIAPNSEGPIPINLFMEPGNTSLREMVESTRKGIYVTRFHYTNVVEPMNAVITGMTRDGTFLIQDGEITQPIKNLRFTESILRALSRISAISRERRVTSEGTVYSRRFVTGTVAPAVKVDGFTFSGISSL